MAQGWLTTHVLDTARGLPAAGMALALWRIAQDGGRTRLTAARTNVDGRTDAPLLAGADFRPGRYELVFAAGEWLRAEGLVAGAQGVPFLDEIPLRFGIAEAGRHLHVPLLLAPYSYSTYRGS